MAARCCWHTPDRAGREQHGNPKTQPESCVNEQGSGERPKARSSRPFPKTENLNAAATVSPGLPHEGGYFQVIVEMGNNRPRAFSLTMEPTEEGAGGEDNPISIFADFLVELAKIVIPARTGHRDFRC
jgi:hypothetical protein